MFCITEKSKVRFKYLLSVLIFYFVIQVLSSQNANREFFTIRTDNPPKIDGYLNDDAWLNAPIASDFYQYEPYNGKDPSQKSEVKIIYSNSALYVGAVLYDESPDSISTSLSKRDDGYNANADFFVVIINPFNDGINSFEFTVTASGVQNDLRHTGTHGDLSWDAVWKSEVVLNDEGWVVEMEIPYSALRFPKTEEQVWGLHLFRFINRIKEGSTWNYVSQENQDIVSQDGTLKGIKNIVPPLRLSVTPYISGYLEKDPENEVWGRKFKGGMDLKYGINESFTLDMILIPDFGQVESDDKILNLSPFEINYSEKRPFFTEGNELFSKANIFYSRRIGGTPFKYDDIEELIDTTEEVVYNPTETRLLNATKISGRLPIGLGIGVFNAITAETTAEIEDTITGETRTYQTQPFTNYNILVFDQSMKNNSYISLINTNLQHHNSTYWANVTGSEFKLANKEQTYAISGELNYSQVNEQADSLVKGHLLNFGIEKIKGNFLFEIERNYKSDSYDPNDMGFLYNNNEVTDFAEFQYNIYKPFWKVLYWRNYFFIVHSQLYDPRKYTGMVMGFNSRTTFKNQLSVGVFGNIAPKDKHDYFEAREDGRLYIAPKINSCGGWISSDYRKIFAFDVNGYYAKANKYDQSSWQIVISPRLRPNNQMLLIYNFRREFEKNDIGYADTEDNGNILFGIRDRTTITNTLNIAYTFTNKASLSFRLRHYWSRLIYGQFHELLESGYLSNELNYSDYKDDHDYNYNNFNIDLIYTWNFAPGSELSVAGKINIDDPDVPMEEKYFNNFSNVIESPLISGSLKVLYYLDYNYFKKK